MTVPVSFEHPEDIMLKAFQRTKASWIKTWLVLAIHCIMAVSCQVLQPGESQTLRFDFAPSELKLFCSERVGLGRCLQRHKM